MTQSLETPVVEASNAPPIEEDWTGFLDVLNCATGHLEIKYDKSKPDETEKAKRIITDMLKRGYLLYVEVGGEQKRVKSFDPEHEVYVLEEPEEGPDTLSDQSKKKPGRKPGQKVPLRAGRATGIAPTAGG